MTGQDATGQGTTGGGELTIDVDRVADEAKLTIGGEVDLATSPQLTAALDDVLDSRRVTLDLRDVGYMDSSGLRCLLAARDEIERRGGTIVVSAASSIVNRLITITGLDDLLQQPPA